MANDWEPQVAGGSSGAAYVAWDSYDMGNYDVFFRAFENGKLGPVQPVTSSARFQAHASVAVDAEGRPWLAWDESGANWGKDQGFLINPPMSAPLHQERSIRVAMWDGKDWQEPKSKIDPFYRLPAVPQLREPTDHLRWPWDPQHGVPALDARASSVHWKPARLGELSDALRRRLLDTARPDRPQPRFDRETSRPGNRQATAACGPPG